LSGVIPLLPDISSSVSFINPRPFTRILQYRHVLIFESTNSISYLYLSFSEKDINCTFLTFGQYVDIYI